MTRSPTPNAVKDLMRENVRELSEVPPSGGISFPDVRLNAELQTGEFP